MHIICILRCPCARGGGGVVFEEMQAVSKSGVQGELRVCCMGIVCVHARVWVDLSTTRFKGEYEKHRTADTTDRHFCMLPGTSRIEPAHCTCLRALRRWLREQRPPRSCLPVVYEVGEKDLCRNRHSPQVLGMLS